MASGDPPSANPWLPNLNTVISSDRTNWVLLEADIRGKLREVNYRLGLHYSGEIGLCAVEKAELNGEAIGYASVLDLIHVHMRVLGILYE